MYKYDKKPLDSEVEIIDESGADHAGLVEGDKIIKISDKEINDLYYYSDVASLLIGKANSSIVIEFIHNNDTIIKSVERNPIPDHSLVILGNPDIEYSVNTYEKAIKYYTKTLNNINHNNSLYSKILHRRGMCYERLKMWEKSENDLIKSLSLVPEEPYVLNYLAYSWLERNINIDKSIKMLEMALNNKKGDPYIIDSLGWGLYLVGRYHEAEKLLQKAVELMSDDPIVNDHYADVLWKLNKNLQANYFWNYVLSLENTEEEMKKKIKKKLIFGVKNNS